MCALTDPDPSVRLQSLTGLDARFDPLLVQVGAAFLYPLSCHEPALLHKPSSCITFVQESNLRLLISGLADENFACREAVLGLLGRLAPLQPSMVGISAFRLFVESYTSPCFLH